MSKNINQSEQTKTVTSEFVNEGERIAELEKSVKSCYLILHTLAITMGFFSFGKFNCFLTFLLGFCIASWGNVLTCFGAMNDWNDDEVNTWSVTVTSVTNFGVAGSTWRGVVLSQSIRGGRTYLHAIECAGDLHVASIYM